MASDPKVSSRQRIDAVTPTELAEAWEAGETDPGSQALIEAEAEYVKARRRAVLGQKNPNSENLAGLAISGGGIRSASFALGVLQALANADALKRFDYLSTVSGGGYIGSALNWWLSGKPGLNCGVGPTDFPFGSDDPSGGGPPRATADQAAILQFLRRQGNYITSGGGTGFLTVVAMALRGMLVNFLIWVPILAAVVLLGNSVFRIKPVTDFFERWFPLERNSNLDWDLFDVALWIAFGVGLLFVLLSALYSLATWFDSTPGELRYRARRWVEAAFGKLVAIIVVLVIVGLLPDLFFFAKTGLTMGFGKGSANWLENWPPLLAPFAGGAAAMVLGLALAARALLKPKEPGAGGLGQALLPAGAVIFMLGVAGLGFGLAQIMEEALGIGPNSEFEAIGFGDWWWVPTLLLGSLALGLVVNLNYMSIHRVYRDRLMETFMPDLATARAGKPAAAPGADEASIHETGYPTPPRGPYHLVNANVVLVDSPEAVRSRRGGDNFIFSPLFLGSNATGWFPTEKFLRGRLSLASAMAISGATLTRITGTAGSGVTRNWAFSLLIAFLKLGLGYWIRNPRFAHTWRMRPNHFHPALYHLFPGNFREDRRFIQLSDGGHFENLALYELIRRKARLILLCDGGADPKFDFFDLTRALRRIWEDFGATIAFQGEESIKRLIPTQPLGFPTGAKAAERGYVEGRITYSDGSDGVLVMLNTTLVEGLDLRILGYRAGHREFPDEPASDQFFDPVQFEAYRGLGFHLGKEALAGVPALSQGF